MTRISRTTLLLSALPLAVPLLTAAATFQFTFTNPAIGSNRALFVLEYFSMAECSPCRRFELSTLPSIQSLLDQGELRIVFRDLPSEPSSLPFSRQLFCLQEYSDFLDRRLQAKRSEAFDWGSLPRLSGLHKARHEQCLNQPAADAVHAVNQSDFDKRQLTGTPAFSLSYVHQDGVAQTHWSGPTSTIRLQSQLHQLKASVSHSESR